MTTLTTSKPLKIKARVTATHIAKSTPGSCRNCAVALAMCDAPRVVKAHVDDTVIDIKMIDGTTWRAETPESVVAFIYDHDGGREVKPFTFTATFHQVA